MKTLSPTKIGSLTFIWVSTHMYSGRILIDLMPCLTSPVISEINFIVPQSKFKFIIYG
jgi:hypothetical protein